MSATCATSILCLRRRRALVVFVSGACLLLLVTTLYTNDKQIVFAFHNFPIITENGFWKSSQSKKIDPSDGSDASQEDFIPLKANVSRPSVGGPGEYLPPSPSKPTNSSKILLLSSGGRSGSSFLGELMSQHPSTFYFFEPRHVLGGVALTRKEFLQQIEDLYSCNFANMNFTATRNVYAILRHPSLGTCTSTAGCDLPSKKHMEGLCKSTSVRIIKIISYPLSWTESLIKYPNGDIRVIHLIRDPRGSIRSSREQMFPVSSDRACQKYNQDIKYSERFNALYPDRFISITYEHLCQHPWEVTQELYHFAARGMMEDCDHLPSLVTNGQHQSRMMGTSARNDSSETALNDIFRKLGKWIHLPSYVRDYLSVHLHINLLTYKELGEPYSTVRDTSSAYKLWRKIIKEKDLREIQSVCKETILKLQHKLFDNIADVRNLSQEFVLSKWKPRVLRKCR